MKVYTNEERLNYAKGAKADYPDNIIAWSANYHETAVIGKDGFGYARDPKDGTLLKMPHKGNVIIEGNVEIGAYTCIDRAVVGSTVIGEGSKLDNFVHVGHGAKIGKHCLLVAHCSIGGSAEIGDLTFIGNGAVIRNKVRVGKNCLIGQMANVVCDVPDGEVWAGNPAKFVRKNVIETAG